MQRARLPLLLSLVLSTACQTLGLGSNPPMAPSPARLEALALPPARAGLLAAGEADKLLPVSGKQVVRLLDAGAAPRDELRYLLTQGTTEQLRLTLDATRGLSKAGQPANALELPTMTLLLSLTPSARNDQGEWRIDATLEEISTHGDNKGSQEDEEISSEVNPDLAEMTGLGLSYWLSPQGDVHDAKLDVPENADPEELETLGDIRDTLWAEISTPLPAERIGVGAKWQVITRLPGSGMDLLQNATYTLESRDGNKVVISMVLEELAASPDLQLDTLPEGYSVKVRSFSSSQTGVWELDMKAITPERGQAEQKTAVTFGEAGEGADPNDEMRVETRTRLQFARPDR